MAGVTNFLSVASADMDTETLDPGIAGAETTEYRGNAVWRNGKVERVLFPGGYATLAGGREDGEPTFHYYTTDYLGNVRAVINGTTGETEQTIAYYPFGGVISTLGTNRGLQPYKFGGKELLSANGLNEYDFGARSYVSSVPVFSTVDPLCEKYYWLSPYLYCGNNPVNITDPTGMIWENEEEIDRLRNNINNRISNLNDKIRETQENIAANVGNEKKTSKLQSHMTNLTEQSKALKQSLADIDVLTNDSHIYAFAPAVSSEHHVIQGGTDNQIIIQASEDALAVHEITHVRQALNDNNMQFDKYGRLLTPGANHSINSRYSDMSNYEIEAYQNQYSMKNNSLPVGVRSIGDINLKYLSNLFNQQKGIYQYDYARRLYLYYKNKSN